jgi:hypothetical protein
MPYHLTIRPIYFVSLLGRGSVIFDEPHKSSGVFLVDQSQQQQFC